MSDFVWRVECIHFWDGVESGVLIKNDADAEHKIKRFVLWNFCNNIYRENNYDDFYTFLQTQDEKSRPPLPENVEKILSMSLDLDSYKINQEVQLCERDENNIYYWLTKAKIY